MPEKRQINVRVSEGAYAVLKAFSRFESTTTCPTCNSPWSPTEEYQGQSISSIAAKILEEGIKSKYLRGNSDGNP
tara:strand:- start:1614 stop:1838 length:225 start_codon:yes stop_codon:yes gene_type:complete